MQKNILLLKCIITKAKFGSIEKTLYTASFIITTEI